MPKTISLRDLNRTLLSRQLLLEPADHPTLKTVEQLIGLQAQVASPPYFGLWSRLARFEPTHLMELRDSKKVLRAALLRSTLHWVSTKDYAWMRPTIQPALERAWQGFFGVRRSGIEVGPICDLARTLLADGPLTLSHLSDGLLKEFPQWNKEAMEYGVRTHLPLVQVPPAGAWKGGTAAKYELVPVNDTPDPPKLVRRYLAAFGPATARDVAAWAGFTAIGKTLEAMRDELVEYQDEAGRALYDLPKSTIVEGKAPAPIRFVAEYDNLVLSHADRSRILPDAHRKRVLLSAGRVLATVLINGFAGGTWKVEKVKKTARLRVELFVEPKAKLRREVECEGERLLDFAEPTLTAHEVDVRWIV